MAEPDAKAVAFLKQMRVLETQRSVWEAHWQEIADYVVPRKADITKKRTAGAKRSQLIFDGTAIHALELLSSSLHGMLTSASTAWFTLGFSNPALNRDDKAKEWLEMATDSLYDAFDRSNFQEQVQELYQDLVAFGTGCMFVESAEPAGLRFSTRHISELYISENADGRVDQIYRKFKLTARAAVNRWGEAAVGERVAKTYKEEPHKEVSIVHHVSPRDDYNTSKRGAMDKPFMSCYIEPELKKVIHEGGYDEFPFLVPRWLKASFELGYGRSVCMKALPDIKMLNKMSETTIKSAQKQVDPPLLVPDDGFVMPVRTVPGGINYYRAGTRDRIETMAIGANTPLGLSMEQQRRDAIRQAFYVDQLILQEGPAMTATEVVQRNEEKMRILGPVLGRLQAEFLEPLIGRTFSILTRQNALPPVPEFLVGMPLAIQYVSPLAKAQKLGDLQSVLRTMEILQPFASVDPSVLDYLDTDGLALHVMDVLGVPARVRKGQEEVQQMREERQQQQQANQQQEQAMQGAQMAGQAAPMVKAITNAEQAGATAPLQAA
jgi:hypothetical protein